MCAWSWVISYTYFMQHDWPVIWRIWPESRQVFSPQEVVNEDLTSWCLYFRHSLHVPCCCTGLSFDWETLKPVSFLACVFTLPGMALDFVSDSKNYSIKDRLCHMDSYWNRLLGSVVTITTWSRTTRWTALHDFLHKYIDAHLDNDHAMRLSLGLIPCYSWCQGNLKAGWSA